MELETYVGIVTRHLRAIVSTFVLVLAVVAIGTLFTPPAYTSKATLRFATVTGGSFDFINYDTEYTDRLMNTLAKLATSEATATRLREQFSLDHAPKVKATILPQTELMEIEVESRYPETSQVLADALIKILVAEGQNQPNLELGNATQELETRALSAQAELIEAQGNYQRVFTQTPTDTVKISMLQQAVDLKQKLYLSLLELSNRLRVIGALRTDLIQVEQPASLPTKASSPSFGLNLGLAAVFGLIAGLGIAFLLSNLDTRLYNVQRVRAATGLPVLAEIAIDHDGTSGDGLHSGTSKSSLAATGIFRLCANVLSLSQRDAIRSFAIVSSGPDEHRSAVVIHLARSLALTDRWVALVDADVREPSLHRAMNTDNKAGLSNILRGEMVWDRVAHTPVAGVHAITSGATSPNSGELLDVSAVRKVVKVLEERHDIVLLQSSPVFSSDDSLAVAQSVQAVALLVDCRQARRDAEHDAVHQLQEMGINVVGVIVNGTGRQRPVQIQTERSVVPIPSTGSLPSRTPNQKQGANLNSTITTHET